MTGFCLEPRPRALVSYYGYGDIVGPWYSQPDEFYRRQPLVSKEDAYASVGSLTLFGTRRSQSTRTVLPVLQAERTLAEGSFGT